MKSPETPLSAPLSSEWPKISVIVVLYNGEKWVQNCFSTLLESDYPDFEVIAVDNASSDNGAKLTKELFPDVKVIENDQNLGFSGGNNSGFAHCSGDIIFLLNQDTTIRPDCLSALAKAFAEVPDAGVIGCKIYYPESNIIQHAGGIIHPNAQSNHFGNMEEDHGQYDLRRPVDYVTGAALAVRREIAEKTGLLDEDYFPGYFEETDLCAKTRRLGYEVYYEPTAVIDHYESTTLKVASYRFLLFYHRNRIKYILKNYSARDFWYKFLKTEKYWLRNHAPKADYKPLAYAYLWGITFFLKLCWRRYIMRVQGV